MTATRPAAGSTGDVGGLLRVYRRGLGATDFSQLLTIGTAAGVLGGVVFELAFFGWATTHGKPAIAPLFSQGTIFFFDDMPQMTPLYALVGLFVHFLVGILGGISFALLMPLVRSMRQLAATALAFGLVLYLVNFEFFGNFVWEWFSNPRGPSNTFAVLANVGYVFVMAPFFFSHVRRQQPVEPVIPPRTAMALTVATLAVLAAAALTLAFVTSSPVPPGAKKPAPGASPGTGPTPPGAKSPAPGATPGTGSTPSP